MQPRPDDRHVARFIEERAAVLPGVEPLDDALVSAVEIVRGPPVRRRRAAFVPLVAERQSAAAPARTGAPHRAAALKRAGLQAAGVPRPHSWRCAR
jgi:hypothetical protein